MNYTDNYLYKNKQYSMMLLLDLNVTCRHYRQFCRL